MRTTLSGSPQNENNGSGVAAEFEFLIIDCINNTNKNLYKGKVAKLNSICNEIIIRERGN